MKVILIDSTNRKVSLVELDPAKERLAQYQEMVGGWIEKGVEFENGDVVYINEEGLFNQPGPWFWLPGERPHIGNGVIVGTTEDGEDREPETQLMRIAQLITFLSQEQVEAMVNQGRWA